MALVASRLGEWALLAANIAAAVASKPTLSSEG